MARKRFTGLMLVSWFIPVVGGVAAYALRKDEDPALARVLLVGTFAIPLQFVGAVTGRLLDVPAMLITLPLALILTYALIQLWEDNEYRHVLWAFSLGVIGAAYAYHWPYREADVVRSSVGRFAVAWVVLYLVLGTLVAAAGSYLWMQSLRAEMAPSFS